MADEFCLKMPDFHVTFRDLLHAVNLRHGTDGFTSPPKEGVLRIFFALKFPTASVGFEHANLGTKGQHATARPPKPRAVQYCKLCTVGCRRSAHCWIPSVQQRAFDSMGLLHFPCWLKCCRRKPSAEACLCLIRIEGIVRSTTRELWAGVANNVPHQPTLNM